MITDKVKSIYSWFALIFFNGLVLFVALNIAFWVVSLFSNPFASGDPVSAKYGELKLAAVYPGKSHEVIQDLLRETWSRPYLYEPFTEFKERPYRGNYVNVDEHGFRFSKNQASWPPDPIAFNIFVFGGSKTFGYGVSDVETIPSRLQEILRQTLGKPVSIFNFGRGYYYSTQERILFERLLAEGHIPTLAIFIDGVNDFYHAGIDHAFAQARAIEAPSEPSLKTELEALTLKLPLARVAARLRSWGDCFGGCAETGEDKTSELASFDDPQIISNTIARYVSNKTMIEALSAFYGVQPIFVWEPAPTYKYDQKSDLFIGSRYGRHRYSIYGYPAMKAFVDKSPLGKNFLWCADIQEGLSKPLYVDQLHYTAEFSQSVASCVARLMVDRGLVSTR